jgi:hypothetical protein
MDHVWPDFGHRRHAEARKRRSFEGRSGSELRLYPLLISAAVSLQPIPPEFNMQSPAPPIPTIVFSHHEDELRTLYVILASRNNRKADIGLLFIVGTCMMAITIGLFITAVKNAGWLPDGAYGVASSMKYALLGAQSNGSNHGAASW